MRVCVCVCRRHALADQCVFLIYQPDDQWPPGHFNSFPGSRQPLNYRNPPWHLEHAWQLLWHRNSSRDDHISSFPLDESVERRGEVHSDSLAGLKSRYAAMLAVVMVCDGNRGLQVCFCYLAPETFTALSMGMKKHFHKCVGEKTFIKHKLMS